MHFFNNFSYLAFWDWLAMQNDDAKYIFYADFYLYTKWHESFASTVKWCNTATPTKRNFSANSGHRMHYPITIGKGLMEKSRFKFRLKCNQSFGLLDIQRNVDPFIITLEYSMSPYVSYFHTLTNTTTITSSPSYRERVTSSFSLPIANSMRHSWQPQRGIDITKRAWPQEPCGLT